MCSDFFPRAEAVLAAAVAAADGMTTTAIAIGATKLSLQNATRGAPVFSPDVVSVPTSAEASAFETEVAHLLMSCRNGASLMSGDDAAFVHEEWP
jgi:hypothetical protein